MNKLALLIAMELVTATIYHADPKQLDDTPFVTASMSRINPSNPFGHRWIAVSKDLEELGFVFDTKVLDGLILAIEAVTNGVSSVCFGSA